MSRMKWTYDVIDERAGSDADGTELLSVSIHHGVVPRSTLTDDLPRADDLSSYKVVRPDDIVLNRMRAFQGAVGVSPCEGIVSPDYLVLRPRSQMDPRFMHYLFRSAWFVGEMTSRLRGIGSSDQGNVRTPRINAEDLGEIPAPRFGRATQQSIAEHLDLETAYIEDLVNTKLRLIELLEERWSVWLRSYLLNLDSPSVPLKRGWSVVDCKHVTPDYVADGYPVVSPGDVTPGRLDLDRAHRFVSEFDFRDLTDGGRLPHRGDIVYSRNASIGIACYVDTDELFCMGQDVCLISSRDSDQLYLSYVLNSLGVDQLEQLKLGSTFNRVNVDQIRELVVPMPSQAEQAEHAAVMDVQRRAVNDVTALLQRQCALLAEHRLALITAAVTGELDVSKAA